MSSHGMLIGLLIPSASGGKWSLVTSEHTLEEKTQVCVILGGWGSDPTTWWSRPPGAMEKPLGALGEGR